ncbi:MAG: hypothetical protein Q7T22_10490, partial [Serpentinimonas sp.]|nr:hypothetical protein [Serpentinimonas sp.]
MNHYPSLLSLPNPYRAVVCGASGAIGQAFVAALQHDARCAGVIGLSRQSQPALLAKDQRAIVAVLSARVGSIEDNHKGGWWSYRASKAALNQLLQT